VKERLIGVKDYEIEGDLRGGNPMWGVKGGGGGGCEGTR